jgi:hypothetical protein
LLQSVPIMKPAKKMTKQGVPDLDFAVKRKPVAVPAPETPVVADAPPLVPAPVVPEVVISPPTP